MQYTLKRFTAFLKTSQKFKIILQYIIYGIREKNYSTLEFP